MPDQKTQQPSTENPGHTGESDTAAIAAKSPQAPPAESSMGMNSNNPQGSPAQTENCADKSLMHDDGPRDGDSGTVWVRMGEKPLPIFELLDAGGWDYETSMEEVYRSTGFPPDYNRYTSNRTVYFVTVQYCDVATMEKLKSMEVVRGAYFERDRPDWAKFRHGRPRLKTPDEDEIEWEL